MKRRFLYTLAILSLAGCNLTEYCEDDQYEQDGKCYRCRTGDHLNADKTGCEANTDTDCGSNHRDCSSIRNVKNSSCDVNSGVCKVTCADGFNESNGRCIDPQAYTCVEDGDCSILNASSAKCQDTVCVFTCNDGYHLATASSCVENTSCSVDECKQLEGVNNAKCDGNQCKVLSCVTGYHLKQDQSGCEKDTDSSCGADKVDCTAIANARDIKCVDGSCSFMCNDGYAKEDLTCIEVSCSTGETMIEEYLSCMKCNDYPKNVDSGNKYILSESKVYGEEVACLLENLDILSSVDNAKVQFGQLKYMRNSILVNYEGDNAAVPKELIFPKLEYLEGISISGRDKDVSAVKLSSLLKAKGDISLYSVTLDNASDFSKLSVIGGDLKLDHFYGSLDLPALSNIHGNLSLTSMGNDAIDFPELSSVKGNFELSGFSGESIAFPKMKTVDGSDFKIDNVILSNDLTMPLESFDGQVSANARNMTITLNSCRKEGDNCEARILFNDLSSMSNTKLLLERNGTPVGFTKLVNVNDVSITISNNSGGVRFPALKTMKGNISIGSPGGGQESSFEALETLDGNLSIGGRGIKYDFSKLKTVKKLQIDSNFHVSGIPSTIIINFPSLTTVSQKMELKALYGGSALTELKFDSLTDVKELEINGFTMAESISIPNLKKIENGMLRIKCCPKLKSINLGENTYSLENAKNCD